MIIEIYYSAKCKDCIFLKETKIKGLKRFKCTNEQSERFDGSAKKVMLKTNYNKQ